MLEWLARPLIADGVVVTEPLDPARLTDADLLPIGLRMHGIMDTFEMPRCEGRLIPAKLFDAMDRLTDSLRHPGSSPPSLAEWMTVAREFGEYYGLAGSGPITVGLEYWRKAQAWLNVEGS